MPANAPLAARQRAYEYGCGARVMLLHMYDRFRRRQCRSAADYTPGFMDLVILVSLFCSALYQYLGLKIVYTIVAFLNTLVFTMEP